MGSVLQLCIAPLSQLSDSTVKCPKYDVEHVNDCPNHHEAGGRRGASQDLKKPQCLCSACCSGVPTAVPTTAVPTTELKPTAVPTTELKPTGVPTSERKPTAAPTTQEL